MRQFLHLLVVDRERRTALTARYGTRWLLPMVCCPERTRAGPLILRWAAEQGLSGDLLGQWLGRLTPDAGAIDWLVVIIAPEERRMSAVSTLWRTPLRSLTSSASLLEYQEWAVRNATAESGLPSVSGPFGRLTWLDEIKDWIDDVTRASDIAPVTPYRVSPFEVVLGISTGERRLFFKGLASDRVSEPRITSELAAVSPESFAKTLALERRPDGAVWWLMEGCPGSTLVESSSLGSAIRVATACAAVQQRVMTAHHCCELPRLDVRSAASWSVGLLEGRELSEDAGGCRAAIERACEDVSRATVPQSWIPLDLDPENVLVDDGGGVRFIDLDDSYLGPAPLAMATLARRITRLAASSDVAIKDALYGAYERAWPPESLANCPWRSIEVVSIVLDAYFGWQRIVKSADRGEVFGALEPAAARTAQQLARAVVAGRNPTTEGGDKP